MAQHADKLRKDGKVLGPLHGIPVLLKDNIDTGDKMQTTAGSFALFGQPALRTPPSPPTCARAAQSSWAKQTSRSGRTFAPSRRPAAGRAAAGKPIILMGSIGTLADPAPAPVRLLRRTLPRFPSAVRPTGASFAQGMPMASPRSSRPSA